MAEFFLNFRKPAIFSGVPFRYSLAKMRLAFSISKQKMRLQLALLSELSDSLNTYREKNISLPLQNQDAVFL